MLHLAYNNPDLAELPDGIFELTDLERLDLGDSNIAALPRASSTN